MNQILVTDEALTVRQIGQTFGAEVIWMPINDADSQRYR